MLRQVESLAILVIGPKTSDVIAVGYYFDTNRDMIRGAVYE